MKSAPELERDRFRGAILGLATGDALGAPVEGLSAAEISARYGGPLREMVGGRGWRPGEWTDDTALALALAESLIECRGFKGQDAAERFLAWLRSGGRGVGWTVSTALERFAAGVPWQASGLAGEWNQSNGSLMRIAPVGLAYSGCPEAELARVARLSSLITHRHPVVLEACERYCRCLARLVRGETSCPELSAPPSPTSSGYVIDTLDCAAAALARRRGFEADIVWAVGLGGDADTVGAVAGALCGARDGAAAIPSRWLAALRDRERLTSCADGLAGLACELARRHTS